MREEHGLKLNMLWSMNQRSRGNSSYSNGWPRHHRHWAPHPFLFSKHAVSNRLTDVCVYIYSIICVCKCMSVCVCLLMCLQTAVTAKRGTAASVRSAGQRECIQYGTNDRAESLSLCVYKSVFALWLCIHDRLGSCAAEWMDRRWSGGALTHNNTHAHLMHVITNVINGMLWIHIMRIVL